MSKRAEDAALKAYPYYPTEVNLFGHKTITADGNSCDRGKYREGYEQAEKDLALTAEDIKQIIKIHYNIVFQDSSGITCGDVAEEVLRRFNEYKEV